MTKILYNLSFILALILGIHKNPQAQELYEYTCLTDHYDMSLTGWLKRNNRVEDSTGVITQNSKYNPLTISVYGILNYYKFKDENDSTFYYNAIDQFKYFLDTTKLVYSDNGKSIGLPYQFKYHDLQAGWISGMTQGFAISYLLRYYDLTKDKRSFDIAEKIAHLMLKKQEEGGSISFIDEKYQWIEEYPNSKSSPQVLNGFINGLIGLHEFLIYFPDHARAKEVHDSSYDALLSNLEKYDTPDWTNYNRKGAKVSNHYMRYEISELEQLYFMYQEPEFLRQIMIWSYMSIGKTDTKYPMYKYPKYANAVPFQQIENTYISDSASTSKQLTSISEFKLIQKKKQMSDNSFKCKKWTTIIFDESLSYVDVHFSKPSSIKTVLNERHLELQFEQINDSTVRILSDSSFASFSFKLNGSEKHNTINEIKTISLKPVEGPKFFINKIPLNFWLTEGTTYEIDLGETNNPENLYFFFKGTKREEDLDKIKWHRNQFTKGNNPKITIKESGYYQFIAVAINTKYATKFSNFDLVKL